MCIHIASLYAGTWHCYVQAHSIIIKLMWLVDVSLQTKTNPLITKAMSELLRGGEMKLVLDK